MLSHLIIHHLAVVEHLELCFQSGMTVLTGETGAGKSILIDALGLTLGIRADSSIVRPGCRQAEISAMYELAQLPHVVQWLQRNALDSDEECVIRRIVSEEGKSRCYINGKAVPLSQIRELGEKLVNIHGQHAHQSLMKPDLQRNMIDQYANHPELTEKVRSDYIQLQNLQKEYKHLSELQGQTDKLSFLQYQIQEIEAFDLQKNELETLDIEHKELAHAEQWLSACEIALQHLKSESSQDAAFALYQAIHQVQQLTPHTTKLDMCGELLNNALIQIEEAASELENFKNSLEIDPKRLQNIDERLSQIYTLARKYRIQPEALAEYQKTLCNEAEMLLQLQTTLIELNDKLKAAEISYRQSSETLSLSRKKAAQLLEQLVSSQMHGLEMPKGQFKIAFINDAEITYGVHGIDQIEFLVTTNPGLPLQPLRKIASGGELSRISLAIQVITSQKMTTPTLIFDEVDAGISGKTAETVGKLLKTLAKETQTLCVTHLPQIAAQGDHHYKVEKQQTEDSTTSRIYPLEDSARIEELARMLGGATITQHALAHAKEMLETI